VDDALDVIGDETAARAPRVDDGDRQCEQEDMDAVAAGETHDDGDT
jgi:hypothetical protein